MKRIEPKIAYFIVD